MRKIIFLDFDGVLHGESDSIFAKRELFEQYLMQMPEVEVVITSSWREDYAFEKLQELFSITTREKIIGVTPSLADGYDPGGRQREIETFLNAANLDETNASWIALDDMKFFFAEECSYLILVNPDRGFSDEEGYALLEWHKRVVGGT